MDGRDFLDAYDKLTDEVDQMVSDKPEEVNFTNIYDNFVAGSELENAEKLEVEDVTPYSDEDESIEQQKETDASSEGTLNEVTVDSSEGDILEPQEGAIKEIVSEDSDDKPNIGAEDATVMQDDDEVIDPEDPESLLNFNRLEYNHSIDNERAAQKKRKIINILMTSITTSCAILLSIFVSIPTGLTFLGAAALCLEENRKIQAFFDAKIKSLMAQNKHIDNLIKYNAINVSDEQFDSNRRKLIRLHDRISSCSARFKRNVNASSMINKFVLLLTALSVFVPVIGFVGVGINALLIAISAGFSEAVIDDSRKLYRAIASTNNIYTDMNIANAIISKRSKEEAAEGTENNDKSKAHEDIVHVVSSDKSDEQSEQTYTSEDAKMAQDYVDNLAKEGNGEVDIHKPMVKLQDIYK